MCCHTITKTHCWWHFKYLSPYKCPLQKSLSTPPETGIIQVLCLFAELPIVWVSLQINFIFLPNYIFDFFLTTSWSFFFQSWVKFSSNDLYSTRRNSKCSRRRGVIFQIVRPVCTHRGRRWIWTQSYYNKKESWGESGWSCWRTELLFLLFSLCETFGKSEIISLKIAKEKSSKQKCNVLSSSDRQETVVPDNRSPSHTAPTRSPCGVSESLCMPPILQCLIHLSTKNPVRKHETQGPKLRPRKWIKWWHMIHIFMVQAFSARYSC